MRYATIASFSMFVFVFLCTGTVHAQSTCTNNVAPGGPTPAGYSTPWDVFSSAKDLLIRGENCTGTTIQATIGSSNPNYYAYRNAYYWNGTAWSLFSLTGGTVVSSAWMTGVGSTQIPAVAAQTYFVGYLCFWNGASWQCGCRDAACATPNWQVQIVESSGQTGSSSGGSTSSSSGGGSTSSSNSGGGGGEVGTGKPGSRGFGGPYAPWNIPAAGLPTAPDSAAKVNKLYEHTGGNFNLNSRLWSIQLREASGTTGTYPVQNTTTWGNMSGKRMPWNPSWQFSPDSDAYVVVVDTSNGHSWEIWGDPAFRNNTLYAGATKLIQKGIKLQPSNDPGNIYTKENGFEASGAVGLPRSFMLVTREEIENGYIPHALAYSFLSPAKGQFVGPATKGAGVTGGAANRLPMGVRVVWDFTNQDIDSWVATLDPNVRKGMRAIAVALRDYGAIGVDHCCRQDRGAMGNMEHDFTAKWDEIGFGRDETFTALHSLTGRHKNKARVIRECSFAGGNKNNTCCYPNSIVGYPKGHQCNP